MTTIAFAIGYTALIAGTVCAGCWLEEQIWGRVDPDEHENVEEARG